MTALLDVAGLCRRFTVGQPGPIERLRGKRPGVLHAVDAVDLRIGEGEVLGLVGESGCGKSTLARVVARLIDPSEGSIRFAGEDIGQIAARRFARHPLRRSIQMVFQDPTESLNPRWTAFDCIADPIRRMDPGAAAKVADRVHELAALVSLPETLLQRFPHQLSGGQKARVGIARAVALRPRLLVLDEPTSALDVSVQVVVLKLLDELKRRLGMSYLFVTHDLEVVRLICDRVAVMYLGRMAEVGTVGQIFERPSHPYTRALLSAVPSGVPGRTPQRIQLSGDPRSPIDPDPRICRFLGRCPNGTERCGTEMPQLRPMGEGHVAACHLADAA
ncbi:ABC transporter ATP-binding protein [Allostella sp. ATCC 35155]|nr:ABC transporter ATP-binding protein [Stella sp. ATCC 35155]